MRGNRHDGIDGHGDRNWRRKRRGTGVLAGKPSGRPLGREVLEYTVGIAFWILMILMIV